MPTVPCPVEKKKKKKKKQNFDETTSWNVTS